MAIEFRPFAPGHLQYVSPQPEQRMVHLAMLAPQYQAVLAGAMGVSGWLDHRCVGAAGILAVEPGVLGFGWTLLSVQARDHMLEITRKTRRVLAAAPEKRIEMYVRNEFEDGHKWAKALGFVRDTHVPLYGHGAWGEDEVRYVRVK